MTGTEGEIYTYIPWLAAHSLLVDRAGGGSLAARIGYWTMTKGWSNSKAVAGVTGMLSCDVEWSE